MNPATRVVLLGLMGQWGPVEFASSALTSVAGDSAVPALTKPAGLEVGDVVFILQESTSGSPVVTTGGGGGAWSKTVAPANTSGDYGALHHRVITQTDIDNAWSLSDSGSGRITALRFHGYGATAVSVKASNASSTDTLTLTGFSKSVHSYGVLSFLAATGSPTPTDPAGFTRRNLISSGAERHIVADRNADYVDGASVTWSTLATGNTSAAFLVEVIGE